MAGFISEQHETRGMKHETVAVGLNGSCPAHLGNHLNQKSSFHIDTNTNCHLKAFSLDIITVVI